MDIAWELLVSVCHRTLALNPGPKPGGEDGQKNVCERSYSLVNRKTLPSLQKTILYTLWVERQERLLEVSVSSLTAWSGQKAAVDSELRRWGGVGEQQELLKRQAC